MRQAERLQRDSGNDTRLGKLPCWVLAIVIRGYHACEIMLALLLSMANFQYPIPNGVGSPVVSSLVELIAFQVVNEL